jgi:hypothetical protein
MLRHDAAWLIGQYREETPLAPGIPYAWLDAGPWRVEREAAPFRLNDVLGLAPAMDCDEPVARLAAHAAGSLRVQRAAYSDGLKSNYAMDGAGELRPLLLAEYGRRLPPLGDARLSNALGAAVVVSGADGRPYLPRRARGQSVFPGGYHCTASGETVWSDAGGFDGLFTAGICRELEEEVGLARADLDWIRPLGLCREFLRAGKPQLFFAARTPLSTQELAARRRAAIARQIARGRQEIEDEVLAEVTPRTLALCTLECAANLALAAVRMDGWQKPD